MPLVRAANYAIAVILIAHPLHAEMSPTAIMKSAVKAAEKLDHVVVPIAKFDIDKREDLTVAGKPWSAIGKLKASSGRSNCTAQLVARDMILTNAHCVVAKGKILNKESFSFLPLYRKGKAIGQAKVIQFWVGTLEPLVRREEDWALLKLSKPLGDKLGWFGLESHDDNNELVSLSNRKTMYSAGYSIEYKELEVPFVEKDCGIRFAYVEALVGHDCSNGPGASGQSFFFLTPDTGGDRADIVAINIGEAEVLKTDIKQKKNPGGKFSAATANVAIPTKNFRDAILKIINANSEKN